eukprot:Colp12_sorted_trinity150504_noHs@27945
METHAASAAPAVVDKQADMALKNGSSARKKLALPMPAWLHDACNSARSWPIVLFPLVVFTYFSLIILMCVIEIAILLVFQAIHVVYKSFYVTYATYVSLKWQYKVKTAKRIASSSSTSSDAS